MTRRSSFTLEEDDFIREMREKRPPMTFPQIGIELCRPSETCRLRWQKIRYRPSHKKALELAKMGVRPREIASQLGIPYARVEYWLKREQGRAAKLELKRQRARSCLMCKRNFMSDGPHNRICGACKGTGAWQSGDVTEPYSFGSPS